MLSFVEDADVFVGVEASRSTHGTGEVPPRAGTAFARAVRPVGETKQAARYVFTQYPAPGDAQRAGMGTAHRWGAKRARTPGEAKSGIESFIRPVRSRPSE